MKMHRFIALILLPSIQSIAAFKPVNIPLLGAARLGSPKLTEQALTCKKESPNQQDAYGNTPLHYAVYLQSKQVSNLLLTHDANTNIANNNGSTPLHIAVKQHNDYLVRQLIRHGANPHTKDLNGNTPLHIAAQASDLLCARNIIRDLIKAGADTQAKNNRGATPLMLAQETKTLCCLSSMQRHQKQKQINDIIVLLTSPCRAQEYASPLDVFLCKQK